MCDMKCPYCNAKLEVCHDGDLEYEEGVKYEDFCPECGKNFVFETTIIFYYDAFKADCLNGEPRQTSTKKHTHARLSLPE